MKKDGMKIQIALSLIIQMVNYIVPLLVAPYISRKLLDVGIGDYSYAYSITAYFTLIISFGFDGYGNKCIANNRKDNSKINEILWNIIIAKTFLFIISMVIYFIMIGNNILTNGVNIFIYFALILVFIGSLTDINFLFYAMENVYPLSIATLIVNVLYMVSIFTFIKSVEDIILYTLLKSGIRVLINVILWGYAYKNYNIKFKNISIKIFNTLKLALPFFLPGLIAVFANMIDQTMLGNFASNVEVGYYQQAYKIISLALSMIGCLSPLILAKVSYLKGIGNSQEVENKIIKSFQLIMFIGMPAVIGLAVISRYFVPLFYGEVFIPATNVIYFLLPTILLSPLASLWMNSFFYPNGRAGEASFAMLIGNLINVVLNIILIPKFQACGAAFATAISNFIILLICIILTRKECNILTYVKLSLKIVISSIFMGIFILVFQIMLGKYLSYFGITIISILIGMLIYVVFCIIMKESFMSYIIQTIKTKVLKKL